LRHRSIFSSGEIVTFDVTFLLLAEPTIALAPWRVADFGQYP
jgi:hypothetical protein